MAISILASGRIRLNVDGVWTVKEMAKFLDDFRDSYAMLLSFLPSTEEIEGLKAGKWRDGFFYPWKDAEVRLPDGKLFTLADLAIQALHRDPKSMPKVFSDRLSPFEELTVDAISISSPGWIDLIGRLNPLQAIHDIIVLIRDWHEKKQRARVETSILELEAMRQRIQLLRDAGFPDHRIQEYVQIWLTPVTQLILTTVQTNQITSSTCMPLPIDPPPSTSAA